MKYLIHQEKMDELNAIVGQQGGPATSTASDAMAVTQTALAAGDIPKATDAMNKAIQANKADGAAWANVQKWHDKRINEDQYGEDNSGGSDQPNIPPNAIQMYGAGGYMQTPDGQDMTINGKNYACVVSPGQWQYAKATYDGDLASMSCDGKQVSFSVTNTPTDPGESWQANSASVNGYKAGQYLNIRIGAGGYSPTSVIIFSVSKYA